MLPAIISTGLGANILLIDAKCRARIAAPYPLELQYFVSAVEEGSYSPHLIADMRCDPAPE